MMTTQHRPRLVEDWHLFHRWWSVRLSALGTVLTMIANIWPDWVLDVWMEMPDEIRAYIPAHWLTAIAVTLFAGSLVARLIKQEGLDAHRNRTATSR